MRIVLEKNARQMTFYEYDVDWPQVHLHTVEEVEEVEVLDEEDTVGSGDLAHLVVYNDDVNTFDWVIQCFMEVLEHTHEQSEQLSLIIHFKGKATVKTAPKRELRPKKDALVERGLSAVIEDGSDDD